MQVVILAGGLGTRLKPLTDKIPKSMIEINNKPFLQHQIELLRENGINEILLCAGHYSSKIKDYFKNGWKFGVHITYSHEGENLLGTGGAIKKAEPFLAQKFFLLYGDSYLDVNYEEIFSSFEQMDKLALMTVYQNFDKYDKSNVQISEGLVSCYDKKCQEAHLTYIDAGLSLVRKESLNLMPDEPFSLEKFYQDLVFLKELVAYPIKQRFYEIGSFSGLEEFKQLVKKGVKV